MPKNRKIRLVTDANIWISTLWTPRFQSRTDAFFDPEYRLLFSEELFDELNNAVRKPKLAKRISRTSCEELIAVLRRNVELVDVHSVVNVCRDPEDDYLLALAKDGNADYLITGDLDLLTMKEFENTKIVSLTDFEKEQKPEWSAAK